MSKAMRPVWRAALVCVLGVAAPAHAGSQAPDLKAFARKFTEDVYNGKHRDRIPEYIHPEFVDRSPGAPPDAHGPEYVGKQYDTSFGAFPDLKFEILDLLADGDRVVMRWMSRAAFRGKLGTVEGAGQPTVVYGISIFRVQDGKIIESWDLVDRLSMLKQMGFEVTPPKSGTTAPKP